MTPKKTHRLSNDPIWQKGQRIRILSDQRKLHPSSLLTTITKIRSVKDEVLRDVLIKGSIAALFDLLSPGGKYVAASDCVTELNKARDSEDEKAAYLEIAGISAKWPGFFGKANAIDPATQAFASHLSEYLHNPSLKPMRRAIHPKKNKPFASDIAKYASELISFLSMPIEMVNLSSKVSKRHPCEVLFLQKTTMGIIHPMIPSLRDRYAGLANEETGVARRVLEEKDVRDCMTYLYGPRHDRIRLYVSALLRASERIDLLEAFESNKNKEAYLETTWPDIVASEESLAWLVGGYPFHEDDPPVKAKGEPKAKGTMKTTFNFPKFPRDTPVEWQSNILRALVDATMALLPPCESKDLITGGRSMT